MKKFNLLPIVVVPLLLISTAAASYISIIYSWNFEIVAYLIFLFTLFYIFLFEQVIPLKQEWKVKKPDLWSDLKHFIFSVAIFDALGKAFALSIILCIRQYWFETNSLWEGIPFLLVFIIANVIGEFLPYVYHRISHQGKIASHISMFLWKVHSIHHLPVSLNWLKTNWVHPVNMFLNTMLKILPLLLLGFSEEIIFLVTVAHGVIAYLSHANIQSATGFLDYIIVTPRVHQFHHSTEMNEAQNFGNILPFWDLLFGTYYNRKGEVDKVGVIEQDQYQYPEHGEYLKQLIFPFRWGKDCCVR